MTKYPKIQDKFKKMFLKKVSDYDSDPGEGVSPNAYGWSIMDVEMWDFIEQSLSEREKRVREEMVDKAFDWIWGGWNLDLSKLDRAKAHFLSLTPQNDTHSQDDLKDLGLKPRKINFKKISKLANIINKAMEKENHE